MTRLSRIVRRRRRQDDGVALIAVVLTTALLSLFLLSSLAYTIQNSRPARNDQDSKIALAAAQAGIDEYVSRLTFDTDYWTKFNKDATNPALTTVRNAGARMPGANPGNAKFRYQVLNGPDAVSKNGEIRLQVTGMSGPSLSAPNAFRTLTATLRPRGFLDFIYLSDLEVVDPELTKDNVTTCSRYYYAITEKQPDGTTKTVQPARDNSCAEIQWITGDTVTGPLHSNDALQINGSTTFNDPKVETSWPATEGAAASAKTWWGSKAVPLPRFKPYYAAPISLPEANTELKALTTPGASSYTKTGCYYTGSTRITFTGTSMKVLSPNTRDATLTPLSCLDVTKRSQEQTITPIPEIVYVDGTTGLCSGVGFPRTNGGLLEIVVGALLTDLFSVSLTNSVTTNYNCLRGTAFVQGNVDAQITVATADDIVVTGDVTLADAGKGTDMVGLVGGSYVWVYHPVTVLGAEVYSTPPVSTIQAAILALRHSFVVQNWNTGKRLNDLNVLGAIAQKFRGPVGTSGGTPTGYTKKYVYDDRLRYLQPPYFLKPKTTPWVLASVTDQTGDPVPSATP